MRYSSTAMRYTDKGYQGPWSVTGYFSARNGSSFLAVDCDDDRGGTLNLAEATRLLADDDWSPIEGELSGDERALLRRAIERYVDSARARSTS